MNENKLKHLEFAQGVINRMAGNSFLLKGWSVTLVAAIFALATKDGNPGLVPVAYLPAVVFWFLDAYFLRQEKLYRKLYDAVRVKKAEEIDFSLDASVFAKGVAPWWRVMLSKTLGWFHGAVVASIVGAQILAKVA
ncbi:MAG: hypothetical protein HYU36_15345 [Planctomycetes bacterium]|nr:hypothetical protein [Planctomycetota bacterium]